jgi:glutathione S-transferase
VADRKIFHLMTSDVWAEQSGETALTESTRGASLAEVGYIHCSYLEQVEAVANAVYADLVDPDTVASALLLLEIDTALLKVEIRVENVEGGEESFPHVYGAVPVDAVTSVHEMVVTGERWTLPEALGHDEPG